MGYDVRYDIIRPTINTNWYVFNVEDEASLPDGRKEGDNYYVYSKVDAEKTKSLVDENYAKNAYSLASFFGDDEDSTATLANLEYKSWPAQ